MWKLCSKALEEVSSSFWGTILAQFVWYWNSSMKLCLVDNNLQIRLSFVVVNSKFFEKPVQQSCAMVPQILVDVEQHLIGRYYVLPRYFLAIKGGVVSQQHVLHGAPIEDAKLGRRHHHFVGINFSFQRFRNSINRRNVLLSGAASLICTRKNDTHAQILKIRQFQFEFWFRLEFDTVYNIIGVATPIEVYA